jgi:spermidine synthase
MGWISIFFFVSGFCSLLYELIWLRLAMAQFGVTTALTSIVLAVFMGGLGAGAWIAGTIVRRHDENIHWPPLRLYALTEFLIGASALLVPIELNWGRNLLGHIAGSVTVSSGFYYLLSGILLAITVMPWCACMGATIPMAMFAIRRDPRYEAKRSFSFLYLANVLGGVAGTVAPLVLIELYGFHVTLRVGALLNLCIAVAAFALTAPGGAFGVATAPQWREAIADPPNREKSTLYLLFTTGLATMGMELIWIRLFTPYIGPLVYCFATILGAYLVATYVGSQAYRFWSLRNKREPRLAWISLAFLGLLPLLTSDLRAPLNALFRVFLGVMPFAGMIGFLTPMLVDRWSAGDPDRAGRAYAVNVAGCIVGPLVSGFVLLPLAGERVTMLLFVVPWFAIALAPAGAIALHPTARAAGYALLAAALASFFFTKDFETQFSDRVVLRDATATVIATGEGMHKRLLTNGVGMTSLTPITKMMAHLTLASLDRPPRNALIICFGMGTTFRSVLSWGIPTTVVELVPSVPRLFSYYHSDAAQEMASPLAHVVIDDGRRYMERSQEQFDAVIIDPPPPVQTAGSSLLYSTEFYAVAKERLKPGGILQQWLPGGDDAVQSSVTRALKNSFPYTRVYHGMEGWGWHFLASEDPIPVRTAAEIVARMPAAAVTDMMEWGPAKTPEAQLELTLKPESIDSMIALSPGTPALQDDRPINEYFLLRASEAPADDDSLLRRLSAPAVEAKGETCPSTFLRGSKEECY